MRQLTEKEKKFVEGIATAKEKGDLEALQVSRIIREQLSFLAIRWEMSPKTIHIHYKEKMKFEGPYYELSDFLYFIEELESRNLIRIQTILQPKTEAGDRILYDRNKYIYNPLSNSSDQIEEDGDFFYEKDDKNKRLTIAEISHTVNINVNIVDYLEKYTYNKIIYPLPLLMDYRNNHFKSLEQRQFEKQLSDAQEKHAQNMAELRKSLKMSTRSFVVSIFGIIAAIIIPIIIPIYFDTKIKETQIEQITEAIKKSRSELKRPIEVSFGDSLKNNIKSLKSKKN
ncbi:hypothetical protein [Bacteroides reticulotermitis]|uniref:hypothetical protein n=1 Tax=Bacteroides reticulotermitis TaxID=1133319 RepID=UPI003A848841